MARSHVHERDLIDALSVQEPIAFAGKVYRVTWHDRDPLAGSLAGGRWAPPQMFEVLYTSLGSDAAVAEIHFHFSRQSVFPSRPVCLHTLEEATGRTLRLADIAQLEALGIDAGAYRSLDYQRCRQIGAAAHFLEYDGMIVPSARYAADNLVLFLDHLAGQGELSLESSSDLDWQEWRLAHPDAAAGPKT
jgi:hypothetical protein